MHGMDINNYNQGMMPLCCMILALTIFKATILYAIPRDRFILLVTLMFSVLYNVHGTEQVHREKLMSFYSYMGWFCVQVRGEKEARAASLQTKPYQGGWRKIN